MPTPSEEDKQFFRSLIPDTPGVEVKPMREYLALPDRWRGTPDRATPWVERALAEIGALPPKQPKPRKR
ncbi:hypothetical protein HJ581_0022705 [Rhodococcus opacus]|nr:MULTISPECIES: hypothetical protein [Rhodococcus]MBA8957954.1 hypothetical protein [Rhodococcus opacus]MBP2203519.1 hypothetical protein [Rhodococcus opacus]MDI9935928.1 hypothetical protein [Rhodococcus sp. IEGM 1351]UNN04356.1 hypothetical protein MOO23_20490 [Rhodococcus opacus]WKN59413.1 hypothetical protein HJ581_0022705 [Rhodococcus opacus]